MTLMTPSNISLKDCLSLLLCITCLLFIGFSLGAITQSSITTWYVDLKRSSLTPPNYAFAWVWSVLYILLATAGWLLWKNQAANASKALYLAQLLLNWAWTPLFFGLQLTTPALIVLLSMVLGTLVLMRHSYASSPLACFLLIPYLAWISLASYLNLYIVLNN